jgi:proline dehydrogenase
MQSLGSYLRRTASSCLMPLAARAARAYIAGPEIEDAVRVSQQLAARGFTATIGFWDGPGDTPRGVADHYLAALDAISAAKLGAYLSIKLPALATSNELLDEVLARAREHGIRIHFDSLGPEAADDAWRAIVRASADPRHSLSVSLPGRWKRSLDDAEAAIAHGVAVCVVKGQWPDVDWPELDLSEGFLNVIDRLAGRARHVSVASHDIELAAEALRRLRTTNTSHDLELLYGLPERRSLRLAEERETPVRFYVPYGKAYLPYALGQARRNPRMFWWLLRDSVLKG